MSFDDRLLRDDEEAKPIPIEELEDYWITNHGRVISTKQRSSGKILNCTQSNKGYLEFTGVGTDKQRIQKTVHRLVLLAFEGPPPEDGSQWIAHHKDWDRENNHLENLRWITASERQRLEIPDGSLGPFEWKLYIQAKHRQLNYYHTTDQFNHLLADDESAKPIPFDKEGYYITDHGHLISTRKDPEGKILRCSTNPCHTGYCIWNRGLDDRSVMIHRMVIKAFYGGPPDEEENWDVHHIDHDRSNNHIDNLMWLEHAKNTSQAYSNSEPARGEAVGSSTLTEEEVRDIRRLAADVEYATHEKIAQWFNITPPAVSAIVNRKNWDHI